MGTYWASHILVEQILQAVIVKTSEIFSGDGWRFEGEIGIDTLAFILLGGTVLYGI